MSNNSWNIRGDVHKDSRGRLALGKWENERNDETIGGQKMNIPQRSPYN
jgi:hypothetical protein